MVFLDVMFYSMVHKHQNYGETYCLHLQGWPWRLKIALPWRRKGHIPSKHCNYCVYLNLRQPPLHNLLFSGKYLLSRPAIGRLKVRCHASLLEHSTEGGSTCHPTSLYGHCSGDWSVWICEGHGRGRKPTEVSWCVDQFGLATLLWFSREEGSLCGGWPAVRRRRSQPGTPVGRGRSGM